VGSAYFKLQPQLGRVAADLYLARGRTGDAASVLAFTLVRDRYWAEGWEKLAAVAERNGDQGEALRARGNAILARRDVVLAMHREARRAAWRGERAKAIDLLERVMARDPGYEAGSRDLERLRSGQPAES